MPAPGVEVSLLDVPGAVISPPTDTGVWFITGLTERGPTDTAMSVGSLNDYVTKYGNRVSYGYPYDVLETFFREGGYKAYVARVVGPAATTGSLNIMDTAGTPAISLVAKAEGPGAWSANIKVAVLAGSVGGNFVIQVQDAVGNILESSGDLATQSDAVTWASSSKYINLSLGVSVLNPKVAAATALSAGNDDRAAITDADWAKAQDNLFIQDLGPGQISQPGRTSTTAHSQLISHAEGNNRCGILDLPDSQTVATLTGAVGHSRFAASFGPWLIIPGVVTGSTRTVPPCALVAGLIGRNDPTLGSNHPSAGDAGIARFCSGLTQQNWNDLDRGTLNDGGANVVRNIYGAVVVYGWRSGANPATDRNWLDFANARFFMDLSAELGAVGQRYMFEEIDGQNGSTINSFHDALAGTLMEHWNNHELFGDTAEKAFFVDTGPTVNTLDTIANLELHAICYVAIAPDAERVVIQIVKTPIAG